MLDTIMHGWDEVKGCSQQHKTWLMRARAERHVICAVPHHIIIAVHNTESAGRGVKIFYEGEDQQLIFGLCATLTIMLQKYGHRHNIHISVDGRGRMCIQRIQSE